MLRGLLIVNPQATSTSHRTLTHVEDALADVLKLEAATTRFRGHAEQLAREAAEDEVDVVVVVGGDGTVNEAVNGLLAHGPGPHVPSLAVIPGGSTNVFARALDLPSAAGPATSVVVQALAAGRRRSVGLGRLDERWFTFTAGLGLDAEVVSAVEAHRASGRRSTTGLYLRTALASYLRTDRRRPALTVQRDGQPDLHGIFLVLVGNTSPWTFLGPLPIDPFPGASFDSGLDVLALRSLGLATTARTAAQLLTPSRRVPHGRAVHHVHDEASVRIQADRPVAAQVDGDWLGERGHVVLAAVPRALTVVA